VSPRLGVALAVTVAVVVLGALGALVLRSTVRDATRGRAEPGSTMAAVLDGARPATAPFAGSTEVMLGTDGGCLRTVVADDARERHDGLRGITALGPYDAMLFVFPSDTGARFTMAGTPLPLDIGWYDAGGRLVDRTTMAPCPDGDDGSCPTYGPPGRYRFALETSAGAGVPAAVGPCG
jgi:uncharacterized membrane protein (UPF0127 family)